MISHTVFLVGSADAAFARRAAAWISSRRTNRRVSFSLILIHLAAVRRSLVRIRSSAHQSDSARQSPCRSGWPARISASMAAISRRQRSIHTASWLRSFATTSKSRPSPSSFARFPEYSWNRRMMQSTHTWDRSPSGMRTASAALAGYECRTGASEKISDDISCLTAVEQCALDQFDRLRCRMNAVRRGLLFLP